MCGSRGGNRGSRPPEKSQKYRVCKHQNHNATKPAFNVGPSSVRQRFACPLTNSGIWIPSPINNLKKKEKLPCQDGTPLTKLSGSAAKDEQKSKEI